MTKELVSVVIPVYNSENSIGNVLSDITRQTYRPLEIILVNDGSTDRSEQIIKDIIGDDAFSNGIQVKCFYQENAGPSKARNKGITESCGDFIAFLDADDFWIPEKIRMQMFLFHKDPGLDIVFSDSKIIRHKGKTKKTFNLFSKLGLSEEMFGHHYQLFNPTENLLRQNFITTPSLIARRKCFSRQMLFNENRKHMEDWELWLKLSLFFRFGYIREAAVLVIDEGDGLHSDNVNMMVSQLDVLDEFMDQYGKEVRRKLSPQMLSKIMFQHFKWGGYYCMLNGDQEKSRILFRKALKEKFDLKIIAYYLKSYIKQYNSAQTFHS